MFVPKFKEGDIVEVTGMQDNDNLKYNGTLATVVGTSHVDSYHGANMTTVKLKDGYIGTFFTERFELASKLSTVLK